MSLKTSVVLQKPLKKKINFIESSLGKSLNIKYFIPY